MRRAHMHSGLPILTVILALTLGIVIGSTWLSQKYSSEESEAVRVAEEFLLNCPTFGFDGVKDSVKIENVSRSQFGWNVKVSFNCAHSGYGNRTGQVVLMVITPHRIAITIEKGQVSSAVIDDVWDEISQSYIYTEEKTMETAREFLLNNPTFRFDGLSESVKIVRIQPWGSSFTWMVELSFTCTHPGYGNRAGLILLQILTDHQISVLVQKGIIARAVIDDVWDEINQSWVPSLMVSTDKSAYRADENVTVTVKNISSQTVRFGSTGYGVSFEIWARDKWVFHSSVPGAGMIVSLEPGETRQITVRLGNSSIPFSLGEYRVLSCGWMDQDGHHISVCGHAKFTVEQ